VNIFTKKNATVGYLVLKALDRRRGRRSGSKLGLYIALGLVSFGILAGIAAVAARRRAGTAAEEPEEESAPMDEVRPTTPRVRSSAST
jgi:hypothetical protein